MEVKEPGYALEGMFCHTFYADGRFQYQGRVESYLGNGYYLVLLYSADGDATFSQIATIGDMKVAGWRFYPSEKMWRDAGDKLNARMAKANYKAPGSAPTLGLS